MRANRPADAVKDILHSALADGNTNNRGIYLTEALISGSSMT